MYLSHIIFGVSFFMEILGHLGNEVFEESIKKYAQLVFKVCAVIQVSGSGASDVSLADEMNRAA